MKSATITDVLTPMELVKARAIHRLDKDHFHKRCRDEIIKPAMERINASLGQENNPDYLAYAIEFILTETKDGH